MHATRHGHRTTEKKEPTPEPARTRPLRPASRHWTLYQQLAHARTLAEHSIQPYTDAAYVERMLQDCTKYGGPGGTHGPTGYHVPHNMGRRSARRGHWGTGYDRSHHV